MQLNEAQNIAPHFQKEPKMAKETLKLARVLSVLVIAEMQLNPNDLISAPDALIKELEKNKQVDSTKAAVDYCKEQGVEPIEIQTEAEPADDKEALKTAQQAVDDAKAALANATDDAGKTAAQEALTKAETALAELTK